MTIQTPSAPPPTPPTTPATPIERLAERLAPQMARVDALIRERMASDNAPRIPEVTAHLIEAGGKRVRPLVTVATAEMSGHRLEDGADAHVKLAATVEFIHTATLLHDDVVDESEQRRGRPTANLLWDNPSSVLVGDYLFARSFQLMVETGSLRVLDILSGAAATIAEGEVLQLSSVRRVDLPEETYLKIVRGKTAALFEAAAQVGGVVAGTSEDRVAALAEYGDALGISFQIVDDWLDYGGAGEDIGKRLGDDFREGKMTLPAIRAYAGADEAERAFWRDAVERGGDFAAARGRVERSGALEATRLEALAWRDRAVAALDRLPGHPLRDLLVELAEFVVARAS